MVYIFSCNKEEPETPRTILPQPYEVINQPYDLVVDKTGNIYFSNTDDNNILKVSPTGVLSAFAGRDTMRGDYGDGGPATAALMYSPMGMAMDAAGNVYFADAVNMQIRKITVSTGIISLVAGNGNTGISGDGGPAISASISYPYAMALDTAGNIYIADRGNNNNNIRKVNGKTGIISTIAGIGIAGFSGDGGPATAAELNNPFGVAVDDSGNVYISDWDNTRIRKVTASTGIINTIATGVAPGNMVIDSAQNLYFVQTYDNIVSKLNCKTGIITTIAGNGQLGNSGDGGPATAAEIGEVTGVALDASGNIYITEDESIRKIAASTGIITTVVHD